MSNKGALFLQNGQHELAIEYFKKMLKKAERTTDRKGILENTLNIANVYNMTGRYAEALPWLKQFMEHCAKFNYAKGICTACNDIGNIYLLTADFDKALHFYKQALNVGEQIGHIRDVSRAIVNIGNIHAYKGEYQEALYYFNRKLTIDEAMKNKEGVAIALGNIGSIYLSEDMYDEAIPYLDRAINVHQQIQNLPGLVYALSQKATCLYYKEDFLQAKNIVVQCFSYLNQFTDRETLFNVNIIDAKINYSLGNVNDALDLLTIALSQTEDEEQVANLHFVLWKLKTGRLGVKEQYKSEVYGLNYDPESITKHYDTALILFKKLYEKAPKHQYVKCIQEMKTD